MCIRDRSYKGFSRVLHLREVPLPGGDSSVKNPSKIGISYLHEAGIELYEDLPPVNEFTSSQLSTIISQIKTGINTPFTSSMGRLFDAVASILGIRQSVSYEAQAAIELENICDPDENTRYIFDMTDKEIDIFPMLRSLVSDFRSGIGVEIIAAKFHNTIADVCLEACSKIRKNTGLSIVALSGGVWQNVTLLKKTNDILENNGFRVLIHHQVPANDGGISLGQLMIAAHSIIN
jgi:hydrogenase maturation protein HypF